MPRVVTYIQSPTEHDLRRLVRRFGHGQSVDPVLPHLSPPLSPEHAALAAHELSDLGVTMVQPEEAQLEPMSLAAALQLLRSSDVWLQMVVELDTRDACVTVRAKEAGRCWLILASTPETVGLAVGGGFVIDKHSHCVLARRWIDVVGHFEASS